MSGYNIYILSCGCRTRSLASTTPAPFTGTFKVRCLAHMHHGTPDDLQRACLPVLPADTVYAECPVAFGGEIAAPEAL